MRGDSQVGTPRYLHPAAIGSGLLLLLGAFLLSGAAEPVASGVIEVVRAVTGVLLLTVVPGALVVQRLDIDTRTLGEAIIYAVGLSIAFTTVLALLATLALQTLGLRRPLSFRPLAVTFGGALLLLVVHVYDRGKIRILSLRRSELGSVGTVVALVLFPILGVAAALTMRSTESNVLGFVFVGAVLLFVVATAMGYVPEYYYPASVFSVALAVLLHRNLVTRHVVGADIQSLYGTAHLLVESGRWAPDMAGVPLSVPVVTLGPAATSILTGLELATVFTVVYVVVFALVPLGIYALGRDVFTPEVALFGAFFFTFYHITFYFTPGKQLLAELFVILLLMTLLQDRVSGWQWLVCVGLLSVGLVLTHYATTYVFGLSLAGAAVGLAGLRRIAVEFEGRLPIAYPVALLAGATGWYWYASKELYATLAGLPASLARQLQQLLAAELIAGSGASYVQQTSVFDQAQVVVYLAFTALVVAGLAARSYTEFVRAFEGERWFEIGTRPRAAYAALALPLFLLLGVSYFLIINLYADRVYQMALVVLAPFAPYGYRQLGRGLRALVPIDRPVRGTRWMPFALLLVVLFALTSGFAPAAAGQAEISTFNAKAHDLAFTDAEHRAVGWLVNNTEVSRMETYRPETSDSLTVDDPSRVPVYTDTVSAQLFRAAAPSGIYDIEVVELKNDWRPTIDVATMTDGYVFIRERSVRDVPAGERVPPRFLTAAERQALVDAGTVIYRTDAVTIVELDGSGDSTETGQSDGSLERSQATTARSRPRPTALRSQR